MPAQQSGATCVPGAEISPHTALASCALPCVSITRSCSPWLWEEGKQSTVVLKFRIFPMCSKEKCCDKRVNEQVEDFLIA